MNLTKKSICGLCVLFSLAIAPAATAQETAQELEQAVFAAYNAKDYDKAIELNAKLIKLQPNDGRHSFNMACLHSLKGESDAAVEWLQKGVKQGFRDLNAIKSDADLTSIRETDGYKAIIAKLEEGVFSFDKAAAASKPIIVVPEGLDTSKPAPLIVGMHPYGATAEWIVEKWEKVAAEHGAILLAPRAVREVPGRDGFSWGAADEADELLGRAIKILEESHKVDGSKTVITGFSQGGAMAFTLGVRHANKFTGIIPVAGRYSTKLAEKLGDAKPKFYMMVGSKDRVVDSNKKADEELEAAGVKSQLVIYDDLGHAFPDNHEAELKKALAFVWGD